MHASIHSALNHKGREMPEDKALAYLTAIYAIQDEIAFHLESISSRGYSEKQARAPQKLLQASPEPQKRTSVPLKITEQATDTVLRARITQELEDKFKKQLEDTVTAALLESNRRHQQELESLREEITASLKDQYEQQLVAHMEKAKAEEEALQREMEIETEHELREKQVSEKLFKGQMTLHEAIHITQQPEQYWLDRANLAQSIAAMDVATDYDQMNDLFCDIVDGCNYLSTLKDVEMEDTEEYFTYEQFCQRENHYWHGQMKKNRTCKCKGECQCQHGFVSADPKFQQPTDDNVFLKKPVGSQPWKGQLKDNEGYENTWFSDDEDLPDLVAEEDSEEDLKSSYHSQLSISKEHGDDDPADPDPSWDETAHQLTGEVRFTEEAGVVIDPEDVASAYADFITVVEDMWVHACDKDFPFTKDGIYDPDLLKKTYERWIQLGDKISRTTFMNATQFTTCFKAVIGPFLIPIQYIADTNWDEHTKRAFAWHSLTNLGLRISIEKFAEVQHIKQKIECYMNRVLSLIQLKLNMYNSQGIQYKAQMKKMGEKVKKTVGEAAEIVSEKVSEKIDEIKPTVESLTEAVKQAAQTGEKIAQDGVKIVHSLGETDSKTFSSIADTMKVFVTQVESLRSTLMSALPSSVANTPMLTKIVSKLIGLIASCYAFFKAPDIQSKIAVATSFIAMSGLIGLGMEKVKDLFTFFTTLFEEKTQPQEKKVWKNSMAPQMPESSEDIFLPKKFKAQIWGDQPDTTRENAFIAIFDVVAHFFKKLTPQEMKIDQHRISMLKSYASLVKTGKDAFEFLLKILQHAFYWVYEQVYKEPYAPPGAKSVIKKAGIWMTAVKELPEKFQMPQPVQEPAYRHLVTKLWDEGEEIVKQFNECDVAGGHVTLFLTLRRELYQMNEEVQAYYQTNKGRVAPFMIHLGGEKGTGKSVLETFLVKDFAAFEGMTPFNPNMVFYLKPRNEHQDSYIGQFALVIDDWLQSDDKDDRREIGLLVIDIKNDSPLSFKMAKCELKGKTYCVSKLLLLSQNDTAIPDKIGLQDTQALISRIDINVKVECKKEYKDPTHQRRKIMKGKEPFTRDLYELTIFDNFSNGKDVLVHNGKRMEKLSYDEFFEYASELYAKVTAPKNNIIQHCMAEEDYPLVQKLKKKFKPQGKKNKKQEEGPRDEEPETPTEDEDQDVFKMLEEFEKEARNVTDTKVETTKEDRFDTPLQKLKSITLQAGDKIKEAVKWCARTACDKPRLGVVAVLVGTLGAVIGAWKLSTIVMDFFKHEDVVTAQAKSSEAYGYTKQGKKITKQFRRVSKGWQRHNVVKGQLLDAGTEDIIASLFSKNLVKVFAQKDRYEMHSLFVKNKTVLMTGHFLDYIREDFEIMTPDKQRYSFKLSECDYTKKDGDDVIFMHLDHNKHLPAFKDITKHFVKENEVDAAIQRYIGLVVRDKNGTLITRTSTGAENEGVIVYNTDNSTVEYQNTNTISVRMHTYDGDCTAPYVIYNTAVPRKILGIHVAGGYFHGACSVITQEDFIEAGIMEPEEDKKFVGQVGSAQDIQEALQLIYDVQPKIDLEKIKCPNVQILGFVEPIRTVRQPNKTEIVPSPYMGRWTKINSLPAMLKPRDDVSPFTNGLAKKLVRDVNNYHSPFEQVVEDFIVAKLPYLVQPVALTQHEAINGKKGWMHINRIEKGASIGWPENSPLHKKHSRGAGDFFWVDQNGDYTFSSYYQTRYDAFHASMRGTGPYVPNVFCDFLKDERLDPEKIVTGNWCMSEDGTIHLREGGVWVGNTRVISSQGKAPFVKERENYGAFYENLLRWGLDGFCMLGIKPRSHDWKRLFLKVTKYGLDSKIIAGDLKKMDASIPWSLHELCHRIIQRWYIGYNQRVYQSWKAGTLKQDLSAGMFDETQAELAQLLLDQQYLNVELCNVIHLALNVLYRTIGNPSGRFLTTVWNTIILLVLILISGLEERGVEWQEWSVQEIMEYLYATFAGFGDDHLQGVSKSCSWGMFALQRTCAKYGMIYTGVYKDRPLVDGYSIMEVKFLQRTFRPECGWDQPYHVIIASRMFGCLEKALIDEIVNWRPSTLTLAEGTRQPQASALEEAFMWGREYFEDRKLRWNTAQKELQLPTNALIFDDLLADFDGIKIWKAQMASSGPMENKLEVNNPIEKTVQLTTFTDNVARTAPKNEVSAVISRILNGSDPYPDQNLQKVMSRAYKIGNFTWSSDDGIGTEVFDLDFPQALFNIPNINEKSARFQFARSAVHIRIDVQGTTFHSGKLLVAFMPHGNLESNVRSPYQNINTAASLVCRKISCNTNVSVEFTIPYVAPSHYWNMKDAAQTVAKGWFGRLKFFVLHPLDLSGATATETLEVSVYGDLVSPELAGPCLRPPVMLKSKNFGAQVGEKEEKSDKSFLTRAAEAINNSPILALVKNIGGVTLMGARIGSLVGAFDKPTSVQAPQKVIQESVSNFANSRGLDASAILSLDPNNQIGADWTAFCMDRDETLFSNYKRRPGLLTTGYFDSTSAVNTRVIDMIVDPMNVPYDFNMVNDDYTFYPTHLANLCMNHKFWRGGINYLFEFTTSKYTTCTVRLTWLPDPTYTAAISNEEAGDTVSKTFKITGDTSMGVLIPYCQQSLYQEVNTFLNAITTPVTTYQGRNGQLILQIVNPVTSGQTVGDSRIYFAVWAAGASDFEVARPISRYNEYQDATAAPAEELKSTRKIWKAQMASNEDVTQATDPVATFRSDFEPLVPCTVLDHSGISMGERTSSWIDLMKRFTYHSGGYTSVPEVIAPFQLANGDFTPWNRFLRLFQFVRGSLRFKVIVNSCSVANYVVTVSNMLTNEDTTSFQQGVALADSRQKPIIEFQLPFYTRWTMWCADFPMEQDLMPFFQIDITSSLGTPGSLNYDVFIALGDDFTAGWLINPIPLLHTPESKTSDGGNLPEKTAVSLIRKTKDNNNVEGNPSTGKTSGPSSSILQKKASRTSQK